MSNEGCAGCKNGCGTNFLDANRGGYRDKVTSRCVRVRVFLG